MAAPLLADTSATGCWIADYATSAPPRLSDLATLSTSLEGVLAAEFAGAQLAVGATAEELLLAALGRTVARANGGGVIVVDVDPSVGDRRQAVVPCVCADAPDGEALLAAARNALDTAEPHAGSRADVAFSYRASAAEKAVESAAVDPYVLSVHVRGHDDTIALDWRYDTRSFDRNTVRELAEQFPLALVEITSG